MKPPLTYLLCVTTGLVVACSDEATHTATITTTPEEQEQPPATTPADNSTTDILVGVGVVPDPEETTDDIERQEADTHISVINLSGFPEAPEEPSLEPCPCPPGGYCLMWQGTPPVSDVGLSLEYVYLPSQTAQFTAPLDTDTAECHHLRLDHIGAALGTDRVMSEAWISNTRLRVLAITQTDMTVWQNVQLEEGGPVIQGHLYAVDHRDTTPTLIPFTTPHNLADRGGLFLGP